MKHALFFVMLLFPVAGYSSGYLTPLGTGVEIHKIHAHPTGAITLWVNGAGIANPDNCGSTNLVHIEATGGYETLVSMALTAYVSGKKIGLWSTQCSTIPFLGGADNLPDSNEYLDY